MDIVLRLGAAMVIGGALGLNRELHNKPTGVRTLGLWHGLWHGIGARGVGGRR